MPPTAPRKRSPWLYVGCGCAALVALLVAAGVGLAFYGVSLFRGWKEEVKDPQRRQAHALELLGTDELPEGYDAAGYVRIPLLLEMVVLTKEAPTGATPEAGAHGAPHPPRTTFLYFNMRQIGAARDELRRFMAGEVESSDLSAQAGFGFRPHETLARGGFDLGAGHVLYVSQQGEMRSDEGRFEGIYATALFDCPEPGSRIRFAVWIEPLAPAAGGGTTELAGTPADEEALRAFLSSFDTCRATSAPRAAQSPP